MDYDEELSSIIDEGAVQNYEENRDIILKQTDPNSLKTLKVDVTSQSLDSQALSQKRKNQLKQLAKTGRL